MQRTSLVRVVTSALALLAGQALHGQSAYFQAVTNLNPAGYWPLNESIQPPAPFSFSNVAVNLGGLGAQANGYYGAWYQASNTTWYMTNNIVQAPAVTAPFDSSVGMLCGGLPGQYVIIPRTAKGVINTNLTLTPPFSIEAWVNFATVSSGLLDIISEGGFSTVNYGGPNPNDPFYGGLGLGWAGVELGTYQNYFFFICNGTNGESKAHELDSAHTLTTGNWVYVVATFDGTSEQLWVNNVLQGTVNIISKDGHPFVPDPSTPLMIGSGTEPSASYGNGFKGTIDDVAIYNEVLPSSSIQNHYQTAYGTNADYGSDYPESVLADSPAFYFRLNDPVSAVNAGYPTNTFPVATNYGTVGAAGDGLYQPGTQPGVAGPPYAGFGASSASVAINGWFGGVDVGSGNLPAALNPTGTDPLTLVTWFRGNIADAPGRFQEMVGHGDSSYRLALGQVAAENHFNPGPGPELQFTTAAAVATNGWALNDGHWHMVAGVSDGTNDYMYLDGVLALSSNSPTGINIAGNTNDLLLGGDSEYTYASWGSANTIRNFDGQIAHVAFWTNALSAAGIESLYNAAGVPPFFRVQPVGATNDQGAAVSIPAIVGGSQPISYQWYQEASGQSTFVAVPGQTNLSLSYSAIPTNAIGSWYLVASSSYGTPATSSVVQVYVYGSPTLITASQTNIMIYAGSSPTLTMNAVGALPITYQWTSNGVVVSTSGSYQLTDVQAGATYIGKASNVDGTTSTGSITVTVLPDPTAPYPAQVLADHPLSFWRLDESSGDVAFDYVGGYNGLYTNTILAYATPYDPTTDPTEGDAPGFGIETTNNSYVGWIPTNVNFAAPTNVNGEFSVECWLQEYEVLTDAGVVSLGYGNGGEEFALDCGGNDPAHDLRFYVRDAGGTPEGAVSGVSPFYGGAWHHVVGVCDEANARVSIYIDGTNAGVATIPNKSGVLTSMQSLTIGARQEGFDTQYDNQFIGAIDEVAVYNYALTAAQVQTHYYASGVAPIITSISPDNGNETTNVGSTAEFTVAAGGTPTLYYKWYDPNNNLISTNSTLMISNVQASAQGQYTIVVSNAYGSATGYASLQVILGPPMIVQDISPLYQAVDLYSGLDNLTYSVVASGSQPFSYQWYQDGSKIAGATNSTYTFTALAGTNNYYVTVTNAYTASQAGGVPATSSTATVVGLAVTHLNPSNYTYRVKISFPGYTGQPLTNFPALITLNPSTIGGLAYSQFQSNASDLRFTDASGTAMLPFEIDEWNDDGTSFVWVDVPLLNGTNIWAYWGNSNDMDIAPGPTNVWLDASYEIVYHLKETNFPYADSTGQYPATNGVATTQTVGVVGHGQSFNGTSDFLSPGAVTLSNMFTTYAWVYLDTSAYNIQTIWCNQLGGYGNNGFAEFVDSYNTADRGILVATGSVPGGSGSGTQPEFGSLSTDQWHLFAVTFNQPAANFNAFLDGASIYSGAINPGFALTNDLYLGAFLNPNFWWTGDMDEARIQSGVASTNWLLTTYLNMADQSSFVSYSTVNLQPILSIAGSPSGYVFTWPTNDGAFTLETTTNLAAPSTWTAVTTPAPVVTNGVWEQIVQPAAGSHFFRLEEQ
jgi:hypothetical protein